MDTFIYMVINYTNNTNYFQNNIDFTFAVLILTEFIKILFLNSHEPKNWPIWNISSSSIMRFKFFCTIDAHHCMFYKRKFNINTSLTQH